MIINHNIAAMNTHRQLGSNNAAASKNLEKLSSGLKINKAGDDAAGLAISEKMRGQIRGLDMAQKNSQDAISLIQTAEGALNETHDILQRMRELATQASNDTNVGVDREEIQKEINQLTSEINRVGNTTEFNTQSLLQGKGGVDLDQTGMVSNASSKGTTTLTQAAGKFTAVAAAAGDTFKISIGGKEFSHTFDTAPADAPATSAIIKAGLEDFINKDSDLKGQFTVAETTNAFTITAVAGGNYDGDKGVVSAATLATAAAPGTNKMTATATAGVGTTVNTAATSTINLSAKITGTAAADRDATLQALVGKGFEVNGNKIEFYNVNDGTYKGDAIGVDISKALGSASVAAAGTALASAIVDQVGDKLNGVKLTAGAAGNVVATTTSTGDKSKLEIKDGTQQKNFEASFQVGANQGQSMTIEIADMRSGALGITGKAGDAGFTSTNSVNDGTSKTGKEAALDVSSHEKASAAIQKINDAIEQVSAQRSNLGAFQNRLEHTINNLGTSSENLTTAESRIRDVDMAKEMMSFTKNNILTQAAQAMLAQANTAPQGVLQLLR